MGIKEAHHLVVIMKWNFSALHFFSGVNLFFVISQQLVGTEWPQENEFSHRVMFKE